MKAPMVLLCILDGFGLRDAADDNAVAAAHKPNFDKLTQTCAMTKLDGSGLAVGLPVGQMGNSEVGHLNLGAGRVVYQDITRIDKAIEDGSFLEQGVLVAAMNRAATLNKSVHLFGLVSDGQVHSSLNHLFALADMAAQYKVPELYLHALMDGRDTPPRAGAGYIKQVVERFDNNGLGKVATVGGRYYGMDRDRRWERTGKAYDAIVHRKGEKFADPVAAIEASYAKDVTDEFIVPTIIDVGEGKGAVRDGDVVICFNFRADRARQMEYMLTGQEYQGYRNESHPDVEVITMTSHDIHLFHTKVVFYPVRLNNILGEILSQHDMKQLRTAETEKYAHVTFFFNGGVEEPFEGEDRDMIPSPKVATYDLKPEMSSVELTDNAVKKIESGKYDFVLLNYANPDMVGHTGDFNAAKKAVEAVDRGLGRLLEAVKAQNGVAIVTADHGNAEMMFDPATNGPWTAHTTNLVPCLVFDPSKKLGTVSLRDSGVLADIAPTVLDMLGIEKPREMTGTSLLVRD